MYPTYNALNPQPAHGPQCECNVCRPARNQVTETLSTDARINQLERTVQGLIHVVNEISRGNNHMGYALWCQKGQHSFDENDSQAERMTVDVRDDKGKKTGEERTVHVCGRHAADIFKSTPKSLREIQEQINEATTIGDDD